MGREQAVESASRAFRAERFVVDDLSPTERFAKGVFSRAVMRRMLPPAVYSNIVDAIEKRAKVRPEFADIIAAAMKEWAIGQGATHYCHWFQPLTGATAEKHDAFIDWSGQGSVIEQFDGKRLVQGEPDASSFPSGGLRSTWEARGYTGWDPTSPAFLWKGGDGTTLYIPSVFFSWTGEVLDTKIPLHRSEEKINQAVLRLLQKTNCLAERVHTTIGWEQEYFIIDRALRIARPDLLLLGRTVFGAKPSKGQELEDHYFGTVKDRILAFMQDFENAALELGIPIKTRHNEVAPAQHEAAAFYETASLAVDHNILAMELMRHVALKHELAVLLHEKPFAYVNGSGKHLNWSLATDKGVNLLDPQHQNGLQFVFLLTAVVHAVHRHADLLRAFISSRGNEFRLGACEAPPAIISVFLGDELEELLNALESGREPKAMTKRLYDVGVLDLPHLFCDNTDRNRTSPFAFTGNKFEYRAVGSSASCAGVVALLNLAVAETLNEMLDAQEATRGSFAETAAPVLQQYLKSSKAVRFSGNNYGEAWHKEAKTRGLPHLRTSPQAFEALLTQKSEALFHGVLTKAELAGRFEIESETYAKTVNIEANLCIELFRTQILPAAVRTLNELAQGVRQTKELLGAESTLKDVLVELSETIGQAVVKCDALEKARLMAHETEGPKAAAAFCDTVAPAIEALRKEVDRLELLVEDRHWPLPKYRELLFVV